MSSIFTVGQKVSGRVEPNNSQLHKEQIDCYLKSLEIDTSLLRQVLSSDSILIVGHKEPDNDCLGAMLGMKEILEKLGKDVELVVDGGYAKKFASIVKGNRVDSEVHQLDVKYERFDTVLALDCASAENVGRDVTTKMEGVPLVNIDHHLSNLQYGQFNYDGKSESSASEIVCYFAKTVGVDLGSLKKETLYALLRGIEDDTLNLTTKSTSQDTRVTHAILEKLIGQNYITCYRKAEQEVTQEIKALRELVLKDNVTPISNEANMTTITKSEMEKLGVSSLDVGAENFATTLMKQTGKTGIVITEVDGGHSVTAVAKEPKEGQGGVLVKPIELVKSLSKFSGGHEYAAGAFVPNMSLEEVKAYVKEQYDKLSKRG